MTHDEWMQRAKVLIARVSSASFGNGLSAGREYDNADDTEREVSNAQADLIAHLRAAPGREPVVLSWDEIRAAPTPDVLETARQWRFTGFVIDRLGTRFQFHEGEHKGTFPDAPPDEPTAGREGAAYKLVPMEPTDKMVAAGWIDKEDVSPREIYRAMLSAAPAEEAQLDDRLVEALKFYADRHHFVVSDDEAWDTVSGEPANYWCDEAGTATVEDGSVARAALGDNPVSRREAQPAEPAVAWQYRHRGDPSWIECTKYQHNHMATMPDRYVVRELYAAPPAVRAQALEWRKPGPVTPDHPLQCLVVLESLRQSDGDWWVAGDHFYPEQKPVAWCIDTPENRAALKEQP